MFKKANQAVKKNEFDIALSLYDKIFAVEKNSEKGLKALKQASHVAYVRKKDFFKSVYYFKQIVLYSKSQKERLSAQKHVADIYFLTNDYEQAISEINQLIKQQNFGDQGLSKRERVKYQIYLARCYFYLSHFFQVNSELETAEKEAEVKEDRFQILLLKSHVAIAQKDYPEAIRVLSHLYKNFPKLSKKEKVLMNLAICYEENNQFEEAIKVLKEHKKDYPTPEYIEAKISRLVRKKQNKAGALGPHK